MASWDGGRTDDVGSVIRGNYFKQCSVCPFSFLTETLPSVGRRLVQQMAQNYGPLRGVRRACELLAFQQPGRMCAANHRRYLALTVHKILCAARLPRQCKANRTVDIHRRGREEKRLPARADIQRPRTIPAGGNQAVCLSSRGFVNNTSLKELSPSSYVMTHVLKGNLG